MTDDMLKDTEPYSLLGRRSLANAVETKNGEMSTTRQMTMAESMPKKPRTSEDFQLFCKIVLEHANYDASDNDETQDTVVSSGEDVSEKLVTKSSRTRSPKPGVSHSGLTTSSDEDDSYNLVTCFCGKPFANRPMIECSKCLTWLHLRCAKVKKSDIPEVFICSKCKDFQRK